MDAIIFIILLLVVIFFFKRISNTVFFIAIFDISLRILTFLRDNTFVEVKKFLGKYVPENIPNIIGKYTEGTFYTILVWLYVIIMMTFLYYVIRIFIRKKKF